MTIEQTLKDVEHVLKQCDDPDFMFLHGLSVKPVFVMLKRQLDPMREKLNTLTDFIKKDPYNAFLHMGPNVRMVAQFEVARTIVAHWKNGFAKTETNKQVKSLTDQVFAMIRSEAIRSGLSRDNVSTDGTRNELEAQVSFMWMWWFRFTNEYLDE